MHIIYGCHFHGAVPGKVPEPNMHTSMHNWLHYKILAMHE